MLPRSKGQLSISLPSVNKSRAAPRRCTPSTIDAVFVLLLFRIIDLPSEGQGQQQGVAACGYTAQTQCQVPIRHSAGMVEIKGML